MLKGLLLVSLHKPVGPGMTALLLQAISNVKVAFDRGLTHAAQAEAHYAAQFDVLRCMMQAQTQLLQQQKAQNGSQTCSSADQAVQYISQAQVQHIVYVLAANLTTPQIHDVVIELQQLSAHPHDSKQSWGDDVLLDQVKPRRKMTVAIRRADVDCSRSRV